MVELHISEGEHLQEDAHLEQDRAEEQSLEEQGEHEAQDTVEIKDVSGEASEDNVAVLDEEPVSAVEPPYFPHAAGHPCGNKHVARRRNRTNNNDSMLWREEKSKDGSKPPTVHLQVLVRRSAHTPPPMKAAKSSRSNSCRSNA